MESSLIIIGSGSLVCLMPLAIYLLYLANLNAKPHAVMVNGSWDFTATLLGLSGFILISGPLLLTMIDSRWRAYAFGNWAELRTFGSREAKAWSLMATGYFFLLLGVLPGLIRSRRHVTAIYNIELSQFETALANTLTTLEVPWKKLGVIWTFNDPQPNRPALELRVEPFVVFNHVLLKWTSLSEHVRPIIEPELEKSLKRIGTSKMPLASWMYTAAVTIMLIMLFWMVLLVILMATAASG